MDEAQAIISKKFRASESEDKFTWIMPSAAYYSQRKIWGRDNRVIKKKDFSQSAEVFLVIGLWCDSCRIQTCNLLIRSQMLYSVELMSRGLVQISGGAYGTRTRDPMRDRHVF